MSAPAGTINPSDGSALPPVPPTPIADLPKVIGAAREAQTAWGAQHFDHRLETLRGAIRRILEARQQVVEIMSQETGRSETECLMSEVVGMMDYLNAAARTAKEALAPERVRLSSLDYPGKKAVIEAVPRGVVAIIAPWNFPLSNFHKSLYPALLAGNAVIMKPSEYTPRTGAWLQAQLQACLPDGLVGLVQGGGDVGAALLDSEIDAIVFTGSVRTGRRVAAAAGERLIPCSVELGGKDAAIVLADCDLDRTAIGVAQWSMMNAGQNCSAIERVYVEAPIAERFAAKLAAIVGALRVAPQDGDADLGPLQNAAQLEIVRGHIADAIDRGAKVLVGGEPSGIGFGFQPTVLTNCNDTMRIMREETFGPVVALQTVADAEEGVARANDSAFGLNGSVWTADINRGEALARQLEVGVALVNNHSLTGIMPQIPWTGVKETGTGVAGSRHAYGTFVRRRTIFVDRSSKPDPWWFPANADMRAFGEAVVARNLGSLAALIKLGGLLGKRVKAIRELASKER